MKNKRFWLVMLVMALVFGLMFVGCGDSGDSGGSDTWTDVTSLSQLAGTWKGSYSESETQQGITMRYTVEMTMTITASGNTGTMTGTQKMTMTYSGSGIANYWDDIKEGAEEEGWTVNDSAHSMTMTYPIPSEPISLSDMAGIKINQDGKKVKKPADPNDETPEIIFIKQ